jgi:hypothetical protein
VASIVQTGSKGQGAATSVSSTLAATTAGNTIVVAAWTFSTASAPTLTGGSCTDNKAGGSSAYTLMGSCDLLINAHHDGCAVWALNNCASGITSVTILDATYTNPMVVAFEVSPLTTLDTTLNGSSVTVTSTPAIGPMSTDSLSALEIAVLCSVAHGGALTITSNGTSFVTQAVENDNATWQGGGAWARVVDTHAQGITESWTITGFTTADGNADLLVGINEAPPWPLLVPGPTRVRFIN